MSRQPNLSMPSYYPDEEVRPPESMAEGAAEKPEGQEDEKDESESSLLPMSMVGKLSPGDTITLKVVRTLEDQVEVAPVETEKSTEDEIDELATEN